MAKTIYMNDGKDIVLLSDNANENFFELLYEVQMRLGIEFADAFANVVEDMCEQEYRHGMQYGQRIEKFV